MKGVLLKYPNCHKIEEKSPKFDWNWERTSMEHVKIFKSALVRSELQIDIPSKTLVFPKDELDLAQ